MKSEDHSALSSALSSSEQLCVNAGSSRLRLLRYITNDPPALIFLASLIVLACCCPLLVLYMNHSSELPDYDRMKVWNSFLGNLPQLEFCISYDTQAHHLQDSFNSSYKTVGVFLTFLVHSDVTSNTTMQYLSLDLNGKQLHTKVKGLNNTRVDKSLKIFTVLSTAKVKNCTKEWCIIEACVLITAPKGTQHFEDFWKFSSACSKCFCSLKLNNKKMNTKNTFPLQISNQSCTAIVKPTPEKYRRHGLILLYLSEVDKKKAESNIYKITLLFIGLLILFLVGMTFTHYRRPQLSHND